MVSAYRIPRCREFSYSWGGRFDDARSCRFDDARSCRFDDARSCCFDDARRGLRYGERDLDCR